MSPFPYLPTFTSFANTDADADAIWLIMFCTSSYLEPRFVFLASPFPNAPCIVLTTSSNVVPDGALIPVLGGVVGFVAFPFPAYLFHAVLSP